MRPALLLRWPSRNRTISPVSRSQRPALPSPLPPHGNMGYGPKHGSRPHLGPMTPESAPATPAWPQVVAFVVTRTVGFNTDSPFAGGAGTQTRPSAAARSETSQGPRKQLRPVPHHFHVVSSDARHSAGTTLHPLLHFCTTGLFMDRDPSSTCLGCKAVGGPMAAFRPTSAQHLLIFF